MNAADACDYGCEDGAENEGCILYLVTAVKLKQHECLISKAAVEA